MLHTEYMRTLLTICSVLAVLAVFILLGCAWSLRPLHPLTILERTQEVEVDKSGGIYQGPYAIGQFHEKDGHQEAQILLLTPSNYGSVQTTQFGVTIDGHESSSSDLTASVGSIQGTAPFGTDWVTNSRLVVTMIEASPDGYPYLKIVAPAGYFSIPLFTKVFDSIQALSVLFWVIAMSCCLIILAVYLWFRSRKLSWDTKDSRATPPGDLRPLELASLHHGKIRPIDLAALLYNLTERGYLQVIARTTEDILFVRTSKNDGLVNYESNFLLVLFPQDTKPTRLDYVIANLNQELFSAVASQLYVDLYDTFSKRGFFKETPRSIHIRYKTVGILFQGVGVLAALITFLFFMNIFPGLLVMGLAMFCAGFLIYRFAYRVVPLSRLGQELIKECAAFKHFLIDSSPLPWASVSSKIFFQFVPYALVLDVAQPWLNRFREHTRWEIPDWYTDLEALNIGPDDFVNQVHEIGNALAEVMVAVKDPNVD